MVGFRAVPGPQFSYGLQAGHNGTASSVLSESLVLEPTSTFSRARSALFSHKRSQSKAFHLQVLTSPRHSPPYSFQVPAALCLLTLLVHQSVGKTGLTRVAFTGNTRSLVWPGSIKACSLMAQLPLDKLQFAPDTPQPYCHWLGAQNCVLKASFASIRGESQH